MDQESALFIVIGEISILRMALKKTYAISSYHSNQRITRRESTHQSISADPEEEDDTYGDELSQQNVVSSTASINDVYNELKRLKDKLNRNSNILNDNAFLVPFCEVIKNKEIGGPITGLALQSILRFVNFGLIDYTESIGSAQLIGESVTKARFLGNYLSSDEVVLMRILLVLKEIITRNFRHITNDIVWEMIRSCFRIAFEPRFSELLQRTSEQSLIEMTRSLFARLKDFEDITAGCGAVFRSNSTSRMFGISKKSRFSSRKNQTINLADSASPLPVEFFNKRGIKFSDVSDGGKAAKCFNLVCIAELLSFCTSLIDPQQDGAENTISVGLNLLLIAFETASQAIGEKHCLLAVVKNELTWNILSLLQPERNISIFSLSIRLAFILFTSLRVHLKYQLESLMVRLLDIITSMSSPAELREISLEYLYCFFQRIPYLAHEIFVNFDCDPYASNLLEDMLNIFSKNCCPSAILNHQIGQMPSKENPATFSQLQKISLNALLACLMSLERAELKKLELFLRFLDIEVVTNRKPVHIPKDAVDIEKLKQKKKIFRLASDHFNAKPSKGIDFLQSHGLVTCDGDIVKFIRDNSKLDKKSLGEYLANKKNLSVLQAFVASFTFKGLRIDEALRMYLESFRLPGEAPLISMILEQFAHHWHESNECPFSNEDAAFSLAYAIIILNVDQHNSNARKQNIPMTCDAFVSNLRQVNGGKDFNHEMLCEIYSAIKENEIVMPSEQQGIVRDRYLWKCLLRRSETDSGVYWFAIETTPGQVENQMEMALLNESLFNILWGPSLAAMTYMFDKINVTQSTTLTRKILNQGFTICALLCAKYGHLDDLIVSLCKFTINSAGGPKNPLLSAKSQLAAQCLFSITRDYVNEIRDSWAEIIKMIVNWFVARFLDESMEFEDFALAGKKVKVKRKEKLKVTTNNIEGSSNFFSSFYSYFAGGAQDNGGQDGGDSGPDVATVSKETDADCMQSNELIKSVCKPLCIIEESKFLNIQSLVKLVEAIVNVEVDLIDESGDDVEVFKLEMLIQVILSNRDRVSDFWPQVSAYLRRIHFQCSESELLSERYISALFRLAIRFTPRPDTFSDQIYQLLQLTLATFDPMVFQKEYTVISLHSFISHSHASIDRFEIWKLINDYLLYVGVGYRAPGLRKTESIEFQIQSEGEETSVRPTNPGGRGYISDSELDQLPTKSASYDAITTELVQNPYKLTTSDDVGLGKDSCFRITDSVAYEKSIETLSLIVSLLSSGKNDEVVLKSTVEVLRKFIEASVKIHYSSNQRNVSHSSSLRRMTRISNQRSGNRIPRNMSSITPPLATDSDEELGDEAVPMAPRLRLSAVTEVGCLKLLQLMERIHSASSVVKSVSPETLWTVIWCPVLQGIALLCCDSRRPIRTEAFTCLQRSLMSLQALTASQWESCFNKVLFPLLAKLIEPLNVCDPIGMDETRMRTTGLLSKVFLQHLTLLLNLPTFTALWLTILDFMDKYMKAEMQTDLVKEAIPESLKNMLLVMDTANCFDTTLTSITWDRINCFLPKLKEEIMPTQAIPSDDQALQSKSEATLMLPGGVAGLHGGHYGGTGIIPPSCVPFGSEADSVASALSSGDSGMSSMPPCGAGSSYGSLFQ